MKSAHLTSKEQWAQLQSLSVSTFTDLVAPIPSEPHKQLMHLFACQLKTTISQSHRADVKSTFKYVSKFIKKKLGDQLIYLPSVLNEFSLDEFHSYLKHCILEDQIHNRYANILQSTYKNVLNKAIDLKTPNFFRFYLPSSFCYYTRVTERYKPYSDKEKKCITIAINHDIKKYSKFTEPYKITGLGRPFFDSENRRLLKNDNSLTLDDARWLFENRMNCKPVRNSTELQNSRINRAFYQIIKNNKIFYKDLFESWGILTRVTMEQLLPFFLKLLQVTGMNVESIYALEIDDLVDRHPATGKPCLRYWKERSDGQKLYHLDIFKADLQWLTTSQGNEVKAIFETVIKLTSYLRERTSTSQKNKLWIFESAGGEIKHLPNRYMLAGAIAEFSKRHNIFDKSDGSKLIETTRFRPTFVSDLLVEGVSIREIQLLMGHKNMYTTMRYLDIHDFGQIARGKIKEKLIEIHINAHSAISKEKALSYPLTPSSSQPLSTPLATCRNIFDPPDTVKALPSYIPGKPCSTYNMCLSCPNVIITETDLPKLFAMKRDYLIKIQNSRILDTPFGSVIKSNLALLNTILNPELSNFSEHELDNAEHLSLYVETTEFI